MRLIKINYSNVLLNAVLISLIILLFFSQAIFAKAVKHSIKKNSHVVHTNHAKKSKHHLQQKKVTTKKYKKIIKRKNYLPKKIKKKNPNLLIHTNKVHKKIIHHAAVQKKTQVRTANITQSTLPRYLLNSKERSLINFV